jgi:hypothetical protein
MKFPTLYRMQVFVASKELATGPYSQLNSISLQLHHIYIWRILILLSHWRPCLQNCPFSFMHFLTPSCLCSSSWKLLLQHRMTTVLIMRQLHATISRFGDKSTVSWRELQIALTYFTILIYHTLWCVWGGGGGLGLHYGIISWTLIQICSESPWLITRNTEVDIKSFPVWTPRPSPALHCVGTKILYFIMTNDVLLSVSRVENRDYGRRGYTALTMRDPSIRKSWH